jgi:protoporphyrinogen oxidase
LKNTKLNVIIGGGITGLACGYYAKTPYEIFEKESEPGGLCRSVKFGGFTFDYAGHFIHARKPETIALLKKLLGKNLAKVNRKAWIHAYSADIPFPFQANLFALPPKERTQCINGFIARKADACAQESFLRWSIATYGKGITQHFMRPYNEKLWTIKADTLMTDWVAPFVPNPNPSEILAGTKKLTANKMGYNASFFYPKKGGCAAFTKTLSAKVKNIKLNTAVTKIDWKAKTLQTSDGKQIAYKSLVSTQPLVELLKQMQGLPRPVLAAAGKLNWNSVLCLNISVKTKLTDKNRHWVYFPEKKYAFYRAGIYTNIMPGMAPRGWRSFYVEFSYRPGKRPDAEKLLAGVKQNLTDCGLVAKGESLDVVNPVYMPYAYVIYDKHRIEAAAAIHNFLREHNIHSIGRYGAWKYSFIEESITDARELMANL